MRGAPAARHPPAEQNGREKGVYCPGEACSRPPPLTPPIDASLLGSAGSTPHLIVSWWISRLRGINGWRPSRRCEQPRGRDSDVREATKNKIIKTKNKKKQEKRLGWSSGRAERERRRDPHPGGTAHHDATEVKRLFGPGPAYAFPSHQSIRGAVTGRRCTTASDQKYRPQPPRFLPRRALIGRGGESRPPHDTASSMHRPRFTQAVGNMPAAANKHTTHVLTTPTHSSTPIATLRLDPATDIATNCLPLPPPPSH